MKVLATKRDEAALRIGNFIIMNAPERATGVYLGSRMVSYGYRTSREKAPDSYIFFEESKPKEAP